MSLNRSLSFRSRELSAPPLNPRPSHSARIATHLASRISTLYKLAEGSEAVFGSPLGPFDEGAVSHYLPHFVYFGSHQSSAALSLAVLAGFNREELPAVRAQLALIEELIKQPDIGRGINVSFFPVANVRGLLGEGGSRDLLGEHWGRSLEPEIRLIHQYSKQQGYQGFLRIASTSDREPSALVRSVLSTTAHPTGVEVFSSTDFDPWPVRFEAVSQSLVAGGPLSFSGDPAFAPFEVELALPADWPQSRWDRELSRHLKRLIISYRGFQAYGQHL